MFFLGDDSIGRFTPDHVVRPQVSLSDTSVVEGTGWARSARITISLSRPAVTPVVVGVQGPFAGTASKDDVGSFS
jgi:hypothetical protein